MFSHRQGRNWYSTLSIRYTDFARATITRDIFFPGPTRCGLSLKTLFFSILHSFAEHWKMVAESSEFHLMLKRAHRAHFFQLEIRPKSGTF